MEDVGLVTAESKSCCFELDLLLFALLHLRSIDDGFLGSCKVRGDIPELRPWWFLHRTRIKARRRKTRLFEDEVSGKVLWYFREIPGKGTCETRRLWKILPAADGSTLPTQL